MIQPDAVGVKGGRIRKAGVELCQPCPKFSAVRNRICIQVWLHRGRSELARWRIWNDGFLGGWLAQP
jgi:hypothetical protein